MLGGVPPKEGCCGFACMADGTQRDGAAVRDGTALGFRRDEGSDPDSGAGAGAGGGGGGRGALGSWERRDDPDLLRYLCADRSLPRCEKPTGWELITRVGEAWPVLCEDTKLPSCADGTDVLAPANAVSLYQSATPCLDGSRPHCRNVVGTHLMPMVAMNRMPPVCKDGSAASCDDGSIPDWGYRPLARWQVPHFGPRPIFGRFFYERFAEMFGARNTAVRGYARFNASYKTARRSALARLDEAARADRATARLAIVGYAPTGLPWGRQSWSEHVGADQRGAAFTPPEHQRPEGCKSSLWSWEPCCPAMPAGKDPSGAMCGGPTRGECVPTREWMAERDEAPATRARPPPTWRLGLSSWRCVCRGNFDGLDCGMCAPGWLGARCDVRATLVRRPLSEETVGAYEAMLRRGYADASRWFHLKLFHQANDWTDYSVYSLHWHRGLLMWVERWLGQTLNLDDDENAVDVEQRDGSSRSEAAPTCRGSSGPSTSRQSTAVGATGEGDGEGDGKGDGGGGGGSGGLECFGSALPYWNVTDLSVLPLIERLLNYPPVHASRCGNATWRATCPALLGGGSERYPDCHCLPTEEEVASLLDVPCFGPMRDERCFFARLNLLHLRVHYVTGLGDFGFSFDTTGIPIFFALHAWMDLILSRWMERWGTDAACLSYPLSTEPITERLEAGVTGVPVSELDVAPYSASDVMPLTLFARDYTFEEMCRTDATGLARQLGYRYGDAEGRPLGRRAPPPPPFPWLTTTQGGERSDGISLWRGREGGR